MKGTRGKRHTPTFKRHKEYTWKETHHIHMSYDQTDSQGET